MHIIYREDPGVNGVGTRGLGARLFSYHNSTTPFFLLQDQKSKDVIQTNLAFICHDNSSSST